MRLPGDEALGEGLRRGEEDFRVRPQSPRRPRRRLNAHPILLQALLKHCQQQLAKYKSPKYVEIMRELPRTPIGKVQKKELRALMTKRYPASEIGAAPAL